ncbi:hypothetical protein NQ314_016940 [Rhamnusium bicolor]|uniref:Uncharacterized protein n=1 Tax=Rhamnusium bicolor TaxID=1586634 RepID=A0AAV8WV98_9CUCU|nr:hypothetical protein NQ314_016940 [Rhamnusium bicolor]
MPDNQRIYSPKFPKSQSWSIENFNTNESEPKRIIRRFINSAIYVEKPINQMPPLRKKSPICLHSTSESEYTSCETRIQDNGTTKLAVRSYTSPKLTLGSNSEAKNHDLKSKENIESTPKSSTTNSGSDADSQITVKSIKPVLSKLDPDMRISLTSLTTQRTGQIDFTEKEEVLNNWLKRKIQEKKKKEVEEAKIRDAKEKERLIIIEQERENFKKWLAEKKEKEEIKRKNKEREDQERQLKEAEKEKRRVENELCFNMWLRRKKRVAIGTV